MFIVVRQLNCIVVLNILELASCCIICWKDKIKCVICRKMYFIKRLKPAALFWRGRNYSWAWNIWTTLESVLLKEIITRTNWNNKEMSLGINIKCRARENQQARIRNQYRDCAAGTGAEISEFDFWQAQNCFSCWGSRPSLTKIQYPVHLQPRLMREGTELIIYFQLVYTLYSACR